MTADNVLFEIKGLKKNFGDLEVLKGIHTTIRKGEVVVVIGPSGSGKSTFIRCLNLLETPTEGQIIFEGSCITDKGYVVHRSCKRQFRVLISDHQAACQIHLE